MLCSRPMGSVQHRVKQKLSNSLKSYFNAGLTGDLSITENVLLAVDMPECPVFCLCNGSWRYIYSHILLQSLKYTTFLLFTGRCAFLFNTDGGFSQVFLSQAVYSPVYPPLSLCYALHKCRHFSLFHSTSIYIPEAQGFSAAPQFAFLQLPSAF